MKWNDYYAEKAGVGGYNGYKGSLYQRGYGLGGIFINFLIG